jgi:hypothetical protein
MAHNSYVRAAGTWASLSVVTAAEMHAFDLAQFGSINGDSGGTWAPSSAIIMGGASGLKMTGPFWSTGAHRVDNLGDFRANVTVAGTLGVTGVASFGDAGHFVGNITTGANATVTGNLGVTGAVVTSSTLDVSGATTLGSTLSTAGTIASGNHVTATGNISAAGNVNASGNLTSVGTCAVGTNATVGGTLTVTGQTYLNGTVSLNAVMAPIGAGHIRRRIMAGLDSNSSYSVSVTDLVIIPNSISAYRYYDVATTGAGSGSEIEFFTNDATSGVELQQGGSTIIVLKATTGGVRSVRLSYVGGTWVISRRCNGP